MSPHPKEEFSLADWETIGLRLLVFTRYWARTHYGWRPGELLPAGRSPEDVACDAYAAFASGQRKLNAAVPLLVQLKGAVRSMLWNLHRSKETALSQSMPPADLEPLSTTGDLAADVAGADFCAEFWRQLQADPQVQRSADLLRFAGAVEAGAESVEEICTATRLAIAQVYELRRRLKTIAERIIAKLNEEGEPHENRHEESNRAPAPGPG